MGVVKHTQSSQNSNFAMSLQYLKKEVRNEADFLHVELAVQNYFIPAPKDFAKDNGKQLRRRQFYLKNVPYPLNFV